MSPMEVSEFHTKNENHVGGVTRGRATKWKFKGYTLIWGTQTSTAGGRCPHAMLNCTSAASKNHCILLDSL